MPRPLHRAGEGSRYVRYRSIHRTDWLTRPWPLVWAGLCFLASEAAVATTDDTATITATTASDSSGVAASGLDKSVHLALEAAALADTLTPRGALIRSSILPGWGQLRNGKRAKAVLFAGAAGGFLSAAILDVRAVRRAVTPEKKEDRVARRNTRFLYFFIAATLAGLDAFVDTHLGDFGDEPVMSSSRLSSPQIRCRLSF